MYQVVIRIGLTETLVVCVMSHFRPLTMAERCSCAVPALTYERNVAESSQKNGENFLCICRVQYVFQGN